MRSFAEESQQKTLELLFTKPITDKQIILGKYFANITLVLIALLPTIIYYISIYMLGSPKGNIDSGAIFGSYVGLIFLAGVFVAVGMLSSAITNNQVIAFIMAIVISVVLQWGFCNRKIACFLGVWDDFIQKFGIDYHYSSISKGLIDTRDILYFISVIFIFLLITHYVIKKKNIENSSKSNLINLVSIVAIIVLINVIGQYVYTYFDLTGDKRFTLSEPTKTLVKIRMMLFL